MAKRQITLDELPETIPPQTKQTDVLQLDENPGGDGPKEDEEEETPPPPPVTEEPKPGLYERRKPGAKIIDRYGDLEKKRRKIDFFGVSDMCLPPITRNTVATYRILGMDEIDRSTGQPKEPVDVLLPGTYIFHDRGEMDLTKKNKLIKYLARPDIQRDKLTGKEMIDDGLIQEVLFTRGHLRVDVVKQYNLYAFIELYPRNKSNPFRNEDLIPIFERVDLSTSRSMAFKLAEQDMAFDAELEVRNLSKMEEIIGYATSAGVPTMENGQKRALPAIKADLRVFARQHPKTFFSFGKNIKPGIRLTVQDAIHWGLIEHQTDKRRFVGGATEDIAHTYLVTEDPIESFVNYLASEEGQEQYQAIVNMVNYWK